MLNSPDQLLYTNHLRAGQKTRLSQPLEDKNRPSPADALCSWELPWWLPGSLQDCSALALQTNPVTRGHTQTGNVITCLPRTGAIVVYTDSIRLYACRDAAVLLLKRHTKNRYEPRFYPIGSASCEFWCWRLLQQETMLWHFSEHASISVCASPSKTTF